MKNPVKKPSWWDEFAAFAIKGNAMALAVGTIIGAAFSTITKSLTDDIIMPIVSIFLGDELTAILDSIVQGTEYVDITKKKLKVGVDTMPEIPQDTTAHCR